MLPNWVDFIVLILFLRATYVGYDTGVLAALLNLLAAVSATSLAINYAIPLWQFIHYFVPLYDVVGQWTSFWLLFIVIVLAIQWLARQITHAAKGERIHWTTQLLGTVFGIMRGLWWAAVFVVSLVSSGLPYLEESALQRSLLGPKILPAAKEYIRSASEQYPGSSNRCESLIPGMSVRDKKQHRNG